MKFHKLLIVLALLMCSCNAQRNVLYLQNIESGAESAIAENSIIKIKPLDQIKIVVNSKNPELAIPFNSSSTKKLSSTSFRTCLISGTESLSIPWNSKRT